MSSGRIHVRFKGKSFDIDVSSANTFSDIKTNVYRCTSVPPYQQILILRGEILDAEKPELFDELTRTPNLFLIENPAEFEINVRQDTGIVALNVSPIHTVREVKKMLEFKLDILADTQILALNGLVLQDELTLSHYNIRPNTTLFLIIKKARTARLMCLIDQLFDVMNDFITASEHRRSTLADEISKLVENPQIASYARIHKGTAKLIAEAKFMLEEHHFMSSERFDHAIAVLQDRSITQFEACATVAEMMQEAMNSDSSEDEDLFPQSTIIQPATAIPTGPLPTCWGMFQQYEAREKEFAQQISVLKKMGFRDETIMNRALREASGNVPQAAKLIFHKFSHE